MYQDVATKLVVPSGNGVLKAFAMAGGNAVQVDYEIIVYTADVIVSVEEGNDLQNWGQAAADTKRTAIGAFQFTASGIASRYARVVVSGAGSIVEACVNTKKL